MNAGSSGGECSSLTLSQTTFYSGGPASDWTIAVTAPSDTCTWTASIDQSWMLLGVQPGPTTITGEGSGTVRLQTVDNRTGAYRCGTFTIGGVSPTRGRRSRTDHARRGSRAVAPWARRPALAALAPWALRCASLVERDQYGSCVTL